MVGLRPPSQRQKWRIGSETPFLVGYPGVGGDD